MLVAALLEGGGDQLGGAEEGRGGHMRIFGSSEARAYGSGLVYEWWACATPEVRLALSGWAGTP
jgi:hypothetical protein